MELGYARVSTAKQDLDRQVDALRSAGIAPERIYLDKKSGAMAEQTAAVDDQLLVIARSAPADPAGHSSGSEPSQRR